MKENLLKKLAHKLKELKTPLVATLMVGTMLVAPLAGCDVTGNINPGVTPPSIENPLPGDDNTENNNSGENTNPGGNQNSGSIQDNKYFKSYSKILQTVLTGSYYSDLIAYEQNRYYSLTESTQTFYDTTKDNYCENIPYGFLEEVGYDIDAIKKADNSAILSEVYILDSEPNNLYMKTAVLNKSSINYYDTYLLKYEIDETEKNDLNRLFDMSACGYTHFKKAMYQAPFFVQELSYQKQPEVVAHSYMEEKTFKWFKKNVVFDDITSATYKPYDLINNSYSGSGLIPMYLNETTYYKDFGQSSGYHHKMSFATSSKGSTNINKLQDKIKILDNINLFTMSKTDLGHPVVNHNSNNILDLKTYNSYSCAIFYNVKSYNVDNSTAVAKTATAYTVHDSTLLNGLVDVSAHVGYTHGTTWLYNEIIKNKN